MKNTFLFKTPKVSFSISIVKYSYPPIASFPSMISKCQCPLKSGFEQLAIIKNNKNKSNFSIRLFNIEMVLCVILVGGIFQYRFAI